MEDAQLEIEALRSIYEAELAVEDKGTSVVVVKKVRPVDNEQGPSPSVVCEFTLRSGYPERAPEVVLRQPRGISDKDFKELERGVQEKLLESQGLPIIFDVLQFCADFILSHQNSSELLCPICLCLLSSSAVISTPCDHYLHRECMDEHILVTRRGIAADLQNPETRALHKAVDKALYCPVCRELVEEEIEPLFDERRQPKSSRTSKGQEDFSFDWEKWRNEQSKLRLIFEKQEKQGGIIDLEAEKQKNLVTEETVVEFPTPPETSSSTTLPEKDQKHLPEQKPQKKRPQQNRQNHKNDELRKSKPNKGHFNSVQRNYPPQTSKSYTTETKLPNGST